ncbi:hypothetical protein ACFY12_23675 [Streptomyces sp. NPDC001339]|uniref:hypothetical protein n=1 Tax=Streptomyces sp. NPDC001339 TaxID=3364563 RepID=UPI00369FDC66
MGVATLFMAGVSFTAPGAPGPYTRALTRCPALREGEYRSKERLTGLKSECKRLTERRRITGDIGRIGGLGSEPEQLPSPDLPCELKVEVDVEVKRPTDSRSAVEAAAEDFSLYHSLGYRRLRGIGQEAFTGGDDAWSLVIVRDENVLITVNYGTTNLNYCPVSEDDALTEARSALESVAEVNHLSPSAG